MSYFMIFCMHEKCHSQGGHHHTALLSPPLFQWQARVWQGSNPIYSILITIQYLVTDLAQKVQREVALIRISNGFVVPKPLKRGDGPTRPHH